MLTEAEAEAQRAEYLEHVAMNKNVPLHLIALLLSPALNNQRPKRGETMHNLLP
jgi:hypothetical protein